MSEDSAPGKRRFTNGVLSDLLVPHKRGFHKSSQLHILSKERNYKNNEHSNYFANS